MSFLATALVTLGLLGVEGTKQACAKATAKTLPVRSCASITTRTDPETGKSYVGYSQGEGLPLLDEVEIVDDTTIPNFARQHMIKAQKFPHLYI